MVKDQEHFCYRNNENANLFGFERNAATYQDYDVSDVKYVSQDHSSTCVNNRQNRSYFQSGENVRNIGMYTTSTRNNYPPAGTRIKRNAEEDNILNRYVANYDIPQKTNYSKRQCVQLSTDSNVCESDQKNGRWTENEDIFLTGIVMDTFAMRHSLKAKRLDKVESMKSRKTTEKAVWHRILEYYNTANRRFFQLTGKSMRARSVTALRKRWLETGKSSQYIGQMTKTKSYMKIWDNIYNVEMVLTGDESNFHKFCRKSMSDYRNSVTHLILQ